VSMRPTLAAIGNVLLIAIILTAVAVIARM
jgi:hypothetical protein